MRHRDDLAAEQFIVASRYLLAQRDFLGEDGQLFDQHRRLNGIEARIHADADIEIFGFMRVIHRRRVGRRGTAVNTEGNQTLQQGVVIGHHRAAVAVATERFGRIEAGGRGHAPFQRLMVGDSAAEPLCRITDQMDAVFFGDDRQGRIIGWLAEQVYRDNGGGLEPTFLDHRFDGGFQLYRIDIVGIGLDIDKHRLGASHRHDFGGGDEGECRHEHRIPFTNAQTQQDQFDGVGAVGAAEGMLRAGEFRQVGFECPDFRAHDIGAMLDDLEDGVLNLRADTFALDAEVDKRNSHGSKPSTVAPSSASHAL